MEDVANGQDTLEVLKHLNKNRCKDGMSPSRLLLTGGLGSTPHLKEDQRFELYKLMHTAFCCKNMIPAITEQHTVVFPFYIDVDLKVPNATPDDKAVEKFSGILVRQVMRFFPITSGLADCIVLGRTGVPKYDDASGQYALGYHIHFPNVLVTKEKALQMREGLINGLNVENWSEELGTAYPDWDATLDKSVYNGGLRMPGAPKASKCKECNSAKVAGAKRPIVCSGCFDNGMAYVGGPIGDSHGHVYDHRVYWLHMALTNGQRDKAFEQTLGSNYARLLRATTVRAEHGEETPGFQVYAGCRRIVPHQAQGGRGKSGKSDKSDTRIPYKLRAGGEITDANHMAIIKDHLQRHHEHYAECRPTATRSGETILVRLVGDNAVYCTNKQGWHKSNRVYMLIKKQKKSALCSSRMKCTCPCPATRSGRNVACADFASAPIALNAKEVAVLFQTGEDSLFDDDPIRDAERAIFDQPSKDSAVLAMERDALRLKKRMEELARSQ